MLNPIIYILRNKQVKEAVKKVLSQHLHLWKTWKDMRHILSPVWDQIRSSVFWDEVIEPGAKKTYQLISPKMRLPFFYTQNECSCYPSDHCLVGRAFSCFQLRQLGHIKHMAFLFSLFLSPLSFPYFLLLLILSPPPSTFFLSLFSRNVYTSLVSGCHLVAQWQRIHRSKQETQVWSLGQKDPLEKENSCPLQYSCLGSPMDREAWWATVHGVTKELDTT